MAGVNNRKTLLILLLCTLALVGPILWHFPPGRATDPVNGTVLDPASSVPRLRIAWAIVRNTGVLVALPSLYAIITNYWPTATSPIRPLGRRLWLLWAVGVVCWLFMGDWYPATD
jgi:hypothetical protein